MYPQVGEVFLYAKGRYQQIQLLIFGYPLVAFLVTVNRLASKAEDCLVVGISHLSDGSGRRITLGYEYAGFFCELFLVLRHFLTIMVAAVAEFPVIHVCPFVAFARLFLNSGYLFTLSLRRLYFLLDDGGDIQMHPQVVIQILCHEIVHEGTDCRPAVDHLGAIRIHDLVPMLIREEFLPHVARA